MNCCDRLPPTTKQCFNLNRFFNNNSKWWISNELKSLASSPEIQLINKNILSGKREMAACFSAKPFLLLLLEMSKPDFSCTSRKILEFCSHFYTLISSKRRDIFVRVVSLQAFDISRIHTHFVQHSIKISF